MKCMRRPDRDNVARVHIAVQAFLGLGVQGEITRIAHCYEVSRLFVSTLLWQLLTLQALEVCAPAAAIRTAADRSILLLRLEGQCSLAHLAHIMRQVAVPCASVGSMSQTLTAQAKALPKEVLTGCQIVLLLCDDIVTLGRPMLRTVEPQSLAILQIALGEHRAAETWKQPGQALADAGWITQHTVVSDQGSGVGKGGALMGLTPHPDWLHLLRPLARCGERFSRQALAAIAREYERGRVESGRSAAVSNKRWAAYEAAKALAEERITRQDHCRSLWTELRKALAWFDSPGRPTALTSRQAEITAILERMRA